MQTNQKKSKSDAKKRGSKPITDGHQFVDYGESSRQKVIKSVSMPPPSEWFVTPGKIIIE